MAAPTSSENPVDEARIHLELLRDALGAEDAGFASLASQHDVWPVWPQIMLANLVGPRGQILRRLDLRWLHRLEATVAAVGALSEQLGGPTGGPTGLSLLVERAAMLGHHGWGSWSAGTSCRFFRAVDGWVAVNLPREDDLRAVAAWLECVADQDAWGLAAREVPTRETAWLLERAMLLGLPVAAVPGPDAVPTLDAPLTSSIGGSWRGGGRSPKVVDLSSLWAGPLCGWYLARVGASVSKVESRTRPDGARSGTPAFYRRLNGPKQLIELDLAEESGRSRLRDLIADADIVIEASRPRALEGWGIHAEEHVAAGAIWCSITGYGRSGDGRDRVAFGDDAAAAAGLVTFVEHGPEPEPWFIGDAAADPVAGATAALGVLSLWRAGRAGLVDVSMRDAVAALTRGVPVPSE